MDHLNHREIRRLGFSRHSGYIGFENHTENAKQKETGMNNLSLQKMLLPKTMDEITPEWLSDALGHRFPGVEVRSANITKVLHGSATKVLLSMGYNEAGIQAGLPPSICLKGGFEAHTHEIADVYAAEVNFYTRYAPELSIRLPTCYFGGIDPDGSQGIVLLEDLEHSGCTFGHATRPMDVDTAAETLEILALLHGQWWNDRSRFIPIMNMDLYAEMLSDSHLKAAYDGPQGELVASEFKEPGAMAAFIHRLWNDFSGEPHCILHADSHIGNMFFDPDGKPGFIDWQTLSSGHWCRDVAYTIVGSLEIEDRRKNDRQLLNHYLDCLSSRVKEVPDFDEAWLSYRRHTMYGLFGWVACPLDMQPMEVVKPCTDRFAVAAVDLETAKALTL